MPGSNLVQILGNMSGRVADASDRGLRAGNEVTNRMLGSQDNVVKALMGFLGMRADAEENDAAGKRQDTQLSLEQQRITNQNDQAGVAAAQGARRLDQADEGMNLDKLRFELEDFVNRGEFGLAQERLEEEKLNWSGDRYDQAAQHGQRRDMHGIQMRAAEDQVSFNEQTIGSRVEAVDLGNRQILSSIATDEARQVLMRTQASVAASGAAGTSFEGARFENWEKYISTLEDQLARRKNQMLDEWAAKYQYRPNDKEYKKKRLELDDAFGTVGGRLAKIRQSNIMVKLGISASLNRDLGFALLGALQGEQGDSLFSEFEQTGTLNSWLLGIMGGRGGASGNPQLGGPSAPGGPAFIPPPQGDAKFSEIESFIGQGG